LQAGNAEACLLPIRFSQEHLLTDPDGFRAELEEALV
jgi:hypothetical protein